VRPGEERSITVDLNDAANRRYSGAVVRYRRVYLTPGGSGADSPVISRRQTDPGPDAGSSDQTGSSTPRRRPAVSDASNDGPRVSITGNAPAPAAGAPAPAPANAPAASPAAASAPATPPPAAPRRRWRRVTDGEDANGPSTPADPKASDTAKPAPKQDDH